MTALLSATALKAIMYVIFLIVGFILLVKGADFFVDGASGIALKLKVSTFIIGVTVVAVGTSAPEMAVTVISAIKGDSGLIVGNILGSNVINIFLILGISALLANLPVDKSTRLIDLPFLLFVSALFVLLGYLGGSFTWWEGLILIFLFVLFMAYNVVKAKKQTKALYENAVAESVASVDEPENEPKPQTSFAALKQKTWFLVILTLIGLAMVVGGAQLVVDSAQYIAQDLIGIPTEIVALTVVAFGTSLPELVTSVFAAKKGDVGIATGNIIGSNIANVLLIGGLGAVCSESGLQFTTEGLISGLVALFAALIIFAFSFGKKKSLGKVSGAVMLTCFAVYYIFVFLNLYIFNLY